MRFSIRNKPSIKTKKLQRCNSVTSECSTSSSNSSSSSFKPDFVADSMKQMNPRRVIEILEMMATGTDNDYAFDCFQSLKNSDDTPPAMKNGKSKRSAKKRSS